MFNDFTHRQIDCTVNGTAEKVILSRVQRGQSATGQEYAFNGLFSPASVVATGAKVVTTENFLVQALRTTADGDKYCLMTKTNVQVTVQRESVTYDTNDNPTGKTFPDVASNVDAYAEFSSASLRMKQEGLLPSTSYTLILQSSVDVKRLDRVVMGFRPFQVDSVDDVRFPNLYFLELSEDTR